MLEDLYEEQQVLRELLAAGAPNLDKVAISNRLGEIRNDLNEDIDKMYVTGDSLIDKWERQIAAGEDPDLDER